MIKTEIQNYAFGEIEIQLCVPNNHDLFFNYKQEHPHELFPDKNIKSQFPYWAKVWHSAIAISTFIAENQQFVNHKKVLEIAAGLGLPSIVASNYAAKVICTDYVKDALYYINESIQLTNIHNCTSQLMNWNTIPENIEVDVLLMSDVNYEPSQFDILEKVFHYFLQKNTTIILATPQRLMAKEFIEKLLPFCNLNKEFEIEIDNETSFVNVMVLQNKNPLSNERGSGI
jgi:predicted nicotinamide N-methyase